MVGNEKIKKLEIFVHGKKYRFKEDYNDDVELIGGFIPKGTIVIFEYPNLGLATFHFESKPKTHKSHHLGLFPKIAFKILEEVLADE